MYIKTQKFFVLGVSKSGYSAANLILSRGGECYIYEELSSPKITGAIEELVGKGAIRVTRESVAEYIDKSDVLVISPGVPINHDIAVEFRAAGKKIIGELEFGFESKLPPIAAVTGTNGKTTTVTLIKSMLDAEKVKSELVGNFGIPVTARVNEINEDTVCVAEVSSFQLESVSNFKPHIACVLNITPDHLTRHYTMDNYIYLKRRILKNQKESEYAVLNYDDETVRSFSENSRAKIIWVSVKEKTNGAYTENGRMYFGEEPVADISEMPVKGEHNVYDALFAISVAKLLGVKTENIGTALKNFYGVAHRVEPVAEINGVKFFDDSKATNTASAIAAIKTMSVPTVLILGGSEKGERYEELFKEIRRSEVKHTVITGASRFNMFEAAGKAGVTDVTVTAKFDTAVKIAKMFANEGDAVLLSPACASFDDFSGYEERGASFVKAIKEEDK